MNRFPKFLLGVLTISIIPYLLSVNCFAGVSETTSYLTITSTSVPADGVSPSTVFVTVQDSYGQPISGKIVNVYTKRGALDTITYPSGQTTDANGKCTVSIVSSTSGADTVWAVVDSSTITQNLVPNPSFECGVYSSDGSPDSWTKITVGGNPKFSWQKVFYSGDKSIAICTLDASDNGYWKSSPIQVTQNINYRLSLYYKCFDGGSGSADIKLNGYGWGWSLSSPTSWTKWSDVFPAESNSIDIRLILNGQIGQTVWFDDLRLERIPDFSFGATRLKFTSNTQIIRVNAPSDSITIAAHDNSGNTDIFFNEVVDLVSSSSTGKFSLTNTPWSDVTQISLSSGIGTFYYKDTTDGSFIITASRTGLISDTQQITVIYGAIKLKFINSPFSVEAGIPSGMITVRALNAKDQIDITYHGYANLSSSSSNGFFSQFDVPWKDTNTFKITNGVTTFYYKDFRTGNSTINASAVDLTDTSQIETVTASSPSPNASYLRVFPTYVYANGTSSCSVSIYLKDNYGNPVSGKTMNISATFGNILPPPSPTDAQGQCTGGINSLDSGNVNTVTATVQGTGEVVSQNLVNNPSLEEGTYGSSLSPPAWTKLNEGGTPYFTWLRTAYSGDKSISIFTPNSSSYGSWITDAISVEPGKRYRVTLYYKTYTTGSPKVTIDNQSWLLSTSATWTSWARTFTTQSTSTSLNIKLSLEGKTGQTVWFDCITLQRIPCFVFTASKLKITSPERTVKAGLVSDSITIEARDGNNNQDSTFNETVILSSSSSNGYFSVSNTAWANTTVIILSSGYGFFYYKDGTPDSPVITVSRAGLSSDTQIVNVLYGAIKLKFTTPPRDPRAGSASDSIVIEAWTDTNSADVTFNNTVTLSTSGNSGQFSVNKINWSPYGSDTYIYLTNGKGEVYYRDFNMGNPVITASRYDLFPDTQTQTIRVSRLKIISPPRTAKAGISSDSIVVQAQDENGAMDYGFNETVTLATSSPQGSFSPTPSPWTSVTYITFSSGQGFFYYKDEATGNPVITVSRAELYSDSQTETVTYGAIKLKIITPARTVRAGASSELIAIEARTNTDGLDVGYSGVVNLITSSNTGFFSVSSTTWLDTTTVNLVNGQANFYYKDHKTGNPVITVSKSDLSSDAQSETIIYGAIKLKITTPERTERAGWPTDYITVQAWTDTNDLDLNYSGTVTLTSSSAQGKFSVSSTNWVDTNSILISSGQGIFYYKDGITGNPVITVSRANFNSDAQSETIIYGAIKLKIITPQRQERAGWPTDTITIQAQTNTGALDVTVGGSVALSSSSAQGKFSITKTPWNDINIITLVGGQANFYYKDRTVGLPTITVSRPSGELFSDTQSEIITYGAIKLKIVTPSRTVRAGSTSESIAVQTLTDTDVQDLTYNGTVTYTSSASTGRFSSNGITWSAGNTFTVNVSGGEAYVYYKDTKMGTPTITVSRYNADMIDTSQFQTIIVSRLKFKTSSYEFKAGLSAGPITVWAQDEDGNKDTSFNETVVLATSSNSGSFSSLQDPWVPVNIVTLTNGEVSFYYEDNLVGAQVITVSRVELISDTQVETVTYGAIKFKITTPARTTKAGSTSDSIAVQAWTDTNVRDMGYNGPVTYTSSSATGRFSLDGISWTGLPTIDVNIAAGETFVYYKDTNLGTPTITVTGNLFSDVQEETITVSRLKITTLSRTTRAGWPTDYITVEAQDENNHTDYSYSGTITLSTSSNTGSFSVNKTIWKDTTILTIVGGTVTFYYKDNATGYPVITASRLELISDTQVEEIIYGAVKIKIITPGRIVRAGWISDSIAIQAQTNTGAFDPTINGPVALATSSSTGSFSASSTTWVSINSIDLVNGEAVFYYKDHATGSKIITVSRTDFYSDTQTENITWGAIKLKIITPQRIVRAGASSDSIVVQAQTDTGARDTLWTNTITIYTSGDSGQFSSSGSPPWYDDSYTLFLISGQGCFYYRDFNMGNPIITVSRYDEVIKVFPDTQIETILVSRLKITSSPYTVKAGLPTDSITIEAQDENGHLDSTFSGTITLSTDSSTGVFSVDKTNWKDTTIIPITGGKAYFYYKDNATGSPRITVSNPVLTSDSQVQTILYGAIKLEIITPSRTVRAGLVSDSIAVQAQTNTGALDISINTEVILTTTSNTGSFSINNINWIETTTISLAGGQAYFYYKDNAPDSPIITVTHPELFADSQVQNILYGAIRLKIVTPPRWLTQYAGSESICVWAQTNTGTPDVTYSGTVTFVTSSSCNTAGFNTQTKDVGAPGWVYTTITVKLTQGQAYVYYKDAELGTHTITVSRYNGDLPLDTQPILVRKGFPWFSDTSAIPYWISPNGDSYQDTVTISYYLGDEDDVEDTVILYIYDDITPSVPVFTLVDTKTRPANAINSEVWDGQFGSTHEGNYHFYINAFDKEGNRASFWGKDIWGHFAMDLTPPNTGSVLINNDFPYADTITVVLSLYSSDTLSGISKMRVSNYPDFSIANLYSYNTSLNWNLLGTETQVVYVQFIDTAGNFSITYSDTILVNTGPPRIAWTSPKDGETNVIPTKIIIAQFDKRMNPATITSSTVKLEDRFFNPQSGAITYDSYTWRISFEPSSTLTYLETYTMTIYGGPLGVKDKDGTPMKEDKIWSFTISDTGDITRPFGWIVINDSATYTNTTVVVLSIFANDTQSNIIRVRIGNDPPIPDTTIMCDSKPYSGTTTWIIRGLGSTDMSAEGNSQAFRVVSAWFEDSAGMKSLVYSDTIILDTLPPDVHEFTKPGEVSNANRTTDVILTFKDLMDTSSFVYKYVLEGGTFQLEEASSQILVPAKITFSETYIPSHSCPVTVLKIDPDNPLNTGVLYRVRITVDVKDKAGNNLPGERQYFFTTDIFSDTTVPETVDQLRATPIGSTTVRLNWKPITKNTDGTNCTDTEAYIIFRSETSNANWTLIAEVNANTTTFTDTTLVPGKTYYYIVVARDTSKNTGPYSTEITSKGDLIFRMSSNNNDGDTYTNIFIPREAINLLDNPESKSILITKDSSKEGEKAGNLGTIVGYFNFTPYLINSGEPLDELSLAPHNLIITLHYKIEEGLIKGTSISAADAAKYLSILHWNGIQWVRLQGTVNLSNQTISANVDHLGKFVITLTDVGVFKVLSAEPNPFTPNSPPYNKVIFSFSNPDNAEVTLRIFDLTGALVYSKEYGAAGVVSAEWDGSDGTGRTLEDGIYIYQIQVGYKFYTGTVILAK